MTTLRLPDSLAGAPHATVTNWHSAPGQPVVADQVLVELETADALVQVKAGVNGTLGRIIAPVGTTVKVGSELGELSGASAPRPEVRKSGSPEVAATTAPAAAGKPATAILMPQAGNTMEEGRIVSWKVKVGDAVKEGQVIAEIETDKSTIEFESTATGVIGAIVVNEGQSIAVKLPIAYLNDGDIPTGAAVSPEVRKSGSPEVDSTAKTTGPVATAILMPQAGNTMEEGRIVSWKVKAGDAVKEGQVIAEIETDKSTIEFESTATGVIGAIVVNEGQSIAVKLPIAYLNDGAIPTAGAVTSPEVRKSGSPEVVSKPVAAPAPVVAQTASSSKPVSTGGTFPASPAARKLAKEKNLDLAAVGAGSGPGGRILSTDLANLKSSPGLPDSRTSGLPDKRAKPAVIPPVSGPVADPVKRPLTKMRKAIATNLQVSKQTVPHFYITLSVDAGALLAFAKARKADTGCSVNDVVMAGLGRAINEFPAVRSRYENDGIVEYGTANIGIAVGLDDGLVVPVVMNVERQTLAQLAAETKRVVENARKGKLENIGKAVFTVSNLGMFGVEQFNAIINPPESGILAVSAAREAVIVKDGAMKPGRLMTLTLSADHRVVDGLLAAKFMARLKEILEAPEQIA